MIFKSTKKVAQFKPISLAQFDPIYPIMGVVAKCVFDCWAIHIEMNGGYPKFNDKNNAPKFSKL
ncbi:MAG TPA: hypothetical protein VIN72_08050 [Lutibacter sp.]